MGVMTALLFAFTLGLGIAVIKGDTVKKFMSEFQQIIEKLISGIIIPLLPFHILGIFANMTFAGQVATIMSVFAKVFAMIIVLHIAVIIAQYIIGGAIAGGNPFRLLKNMLPAYFTAIGTQSSAATIPVTLERTKMLNGVPVSFSNIFPFILMLGVTMVAAPGVPGGAVMAALGLLETMLHFSPNLLSLMIALYLAQDSFGTAANVTGDGAIALIVNRISGHRLAKTE